MARARAPLWLNQPTRYAGIGQRRARIVLALLALFIVACLPRPAVLTPAPPGPVQAENKGSESDLALYEAITDHVRHGTDYYQATAQELRAHPGYPLRPFVTFRLPLVAKVQAALPPGVTLLLLWALAAAVMTAWLRRLAAAFSDRVVRILAAFTLAGGLIVCIQPELVAQHEIWAALLIALSLALRRPGRWIEAAAIACVAMLVRETAALYGIVMMLLAWRDGARREALGWAATLGGLAAAVAAHAWAVAQVTGPLDPVSDGWRGLAGLSFLAVTIKHATVLEAFPFWAMAPVVALALFGWTAWASPLGTRVTATLAAFGLLIAVFARHNNFYWGLMIAPVVLPGLMFVPDALRDLTRAAFDRRRITVTRILR